MRKITMDEFIEEGKCKFGIDASNWKLVCPMCNTAQSINDFIEAGIDMDEAKKAIGFACIGRYTNKGTPAEELNKNHGCNWTLGGILRMHKLEIICEDGEVLPHFDIEKDTKN